MVNTRRQLLIAGAAMATTTTIAPRALSGWEPSVSYPDSAIQILDPSFKKYWMYLAGVEQLATGMRWSEGPVYFGDARCTYWSDTPNDRIMRWDEDSGAVTVYRKPSHYANGNTRDRQGRLITCEHVGRRVSRTEYDGTYTVLIDKYKGKRLNSPNDVVVKSDDTIWFSDPPSGIVGDYNGRKAQQELPNSIYRFDPKSGETTVVAEEILRPNGLAFSPDEKKMYLIDVGRGRSFYVYDVVDNGTRLANGQLFFDAKGGAADGFRVDVDGNLWCGWGGPAHQGVMIISAAGKAIGKITLPERCANVCFGGSKRNRLFMAASHSLYSLYTGAQGVAGG